MGRWWTIDPKAHDQPWQSPYCSMDNNPIWLNDELGDIANEKGKQPTYTAQSGDNLTKIAKKYNTTVDQIVKWNNIKKPDEIQVGQVLKVGPAPTQNSKPKPKPNNEQHNNKEESNWYANQGKGNAVAGTGATAVGTSTVTTYRMGTTTKSFSPKIYRSGFKGNQFTKTFNLGKLGNGLGWGSLGFGLYFDIKGVQEYKRNPSSKNAVHPAKAGLNTGMGLYGIWCNPPASVAYSLVDNFYPGGWPAALDYSAGLQERNRTLLNNPRFNLYRDF